MFGKKKEPKIVIVEDDPYTLEMLGDAFTLKGFKTVLFSSADGDFVERIVEEQPDVISMDIMIACEGTIIRDGFDAIAILKKDKRTTKIPVMILSNFFEDAKVERARLLGAVDFISVTGNPPNKIPDYYLQYLKNPKKYRPSHPHFVTKK